MKSYILLLAMLLATRCALMAQPRLPQAEPPMPQPLSLLDNDARHSLHLLLDPTPDPLRLMHDSHHLFLDLDANGFFYDSERDMGLAKGFSLTGFRLSPALSYGINTRAMLRVGFEMTAFAGLDSLYAFKPLLTLVYMPLPWVSFVAGTLYGGHNHLLGAPVYDPVRHLYHHSEQGIQILTRTRHWQSDNWLDWTHYLTPYTADQEYFTMGTRHEFWLLPPAPDHRGLSLSLPAHFIAMHRGGEVKTLDTNMTTLTNECIGLHLAYDADAGRGRHHLALDLPLYFMQHIVGSGTLHSGNALHPTLTYALHRPNPADRSGWALQAQAGYFFGNNYACKYGAIEFWTLNDYLRPYLRDADPTLTIDPTHLLTLQLAAEHEFQDVGIGIQFDAYHNLVLGRADFVFSFYLRYLGHLRLR